MAAADVDAPVAVKERLEAFAGEVLAEAMNRPVQVVNGGLYLRGLIEQGARKSLEPMVERLGEEANYQSLQQFLADSPWDPALVVRAVAARVAPRIAVEAWVLDDTGFVKDGKRSPGVKRQYSGTLGKVGNCQIGVSVHAVGAGGTVPLGWALYLPEEWCVDAERRKRAKIPDEIEFQTKPELGVELIERATGWELPAAPVLGDCAYGDNTELRGRLHDAGVEYVLSVSAETTVFAPETTFRVPARTAAPGRPKSRPRPDRRPESIGSLIARLTPADFKTVTFRDGPDGEPITSRFAFVRVRAAHRWHKGFAEPPREEWLIAEWPEGRDEPTDYWLSNLPEDTPLERLARLARLRWKIELDYKQLKGELGLDHYEGRSWLGWYHHTALVTAAHGFLTLERLHPKARRPA
ncbi:IS701 family transposase [Actinokineospora sp.]|uniref:IS701 family transposase n=1 Tax=Actinokineospora sp. TaxID=1872133 RepID=UPI003D6A207F